MCVLVCGISINLYTLSLYRFMPTLDSETFEATNEPVELEVDRQLLRYQVIKVTILCALILIDRKTTDVVVPVLLSLLFRDSGSLCSWFSMARSATGLDSRSCNVFTRPTTRSNQTVH